MRDEESKKEDGNILDEIRGKRILLIDSSLLMLPISGRRTGRINIEAAIFEVSEGMRPCVLESTIEELKIIREKKIGKKRLAADFALELIKKMKLCIIPVDEEIKRKVLSMKEKIRKWEVSDNILLEMAKKLGATVATTDLELRDKLRKEGIPVLYLRGRRWLYFEPF